MLLYGKFGFDVVMFDVMVDKIKGFVLIGWFGMLDEIVLMVLYLSVLEFVFIVGVEIIVLGGMGLF